MGTSRGFSSLGIITIFNCAQWTHKTAPSPLMAPINSSAFWSTVNAIAQLISLFPTFAIFEKTVIDAMSGYRA